jgi:hypothetical protein
MDVFKTSYGTTIYDCIKSAVENPESHCGLYAPGNFLQK